MKDAEGVLEKIEKSLGLPSLSKVADTFQRFPDKMQLKAIKEVLEVAERLSKSSADLEKVIEIIRELNSVPTEKLVALERILRRVEKIVSGAPEELLSFITSLKQE